MLSHCRISCSFCLSSGLLSDGADGAAATVAMMPILSRVAVASIMPGFERRRTAWSGKNVVWPSVQAKYSSVNRVKPGEGQWAEGEHRQPSSQRRRDVFAV